MYADIEYDLTPEQWDCLKATRLAAHNCRKADSTTIESLVALGLVTFVDVRPAITPKGRSVLLRGSPRLWDVAA